MAFVRRRRPPQAQRPSTARRQSGILAAWLIIAASVLLLALVISLPLWMPRVVRQVIPSRYIVAYAPPALQALIFDADPSAVLPTAQPLAVDPASIVLPTPLPTIAGASGSPSNSLPGAGSADPSVTVTPAFQPFGGQEASGPAAGQGASVLLEGFTYTAQGWNNCGPATLTTALSYWGLPVTQAGTAGFVKPNPEDKNVNPEELAAYVKSLGYEAMVRIDGDRDTLRRLLAAGYPVVIEIGLEEFEDKGWMGHYLLLIGYSEQQQAFLVLDSLFGALNPHPDPQMPVDYWPYAKLDRLWRHFNRVYLVAYPPEHSDYVAGIIGEAVDDSVMITNALYRVTLEKDASPGDPFVWFNLGSLYAALGDYESAVTAFDMARQLGTPWRMLWYRFDPYEAYLQVGGERLQDVITLADAVLEHNTYSEEAYYYSGRAYAALGNIDEARRRFTQALRQNPSFEAARIELAGLGGG